MRAFHRSWPALPVQSSHPTPVDSELTGPVKVWAFPELHKVNPQTGALLETGPVWTGDVS